MTPWPDHAYWYYSPGGGRRRVQNGVQTRCGTAGYFFRASFSTFSHQSLSFCFLPLPFPSSLGRGRRRDVGLAGLSAVAAAAAAFFGSSFRSVTPQMLLAMK